MEHAMNGKARLRRRNEERKLFGRPLPADTSDFDADDLLACATCGGGYPALVGDRCGPCNRLVRWDYYLNLAIVAAERDPARDLLLADHYDIAAELTDLKDALSWPSPSDAARALASRSIGPDCP